VFLWRCTCPGVTRFAGNCEPIFFQFLSFFLSQFQFDERRSTQVNGPRRALGAVQPSVVQPDDSFVHGAEQRGVQGRRGGPPIRPPRLGSTGTSVDASVDALPQPEQRHSPPGRSARGDRAGRGAIARGPVQQPCTDGCRPIC